ncbi:L-aspartate oxidase [bacterium]|nr:L-aspartate oxidase [bacterium]
MKEEPILIIGSGIAGLSCALELASFQIPSIVYSKNEIIFNNTYQAQGGIAAVWDPSDSLLSHMEDTKKCGAYLGDSKAIQSLIQSAPQMIQRLVQWGVTFDKDCKGHYDLALEAAHSHRRIFHCKDHTGQEIQNSLMQKAQNSAFIGLVENAIITKIIQEQHQISGIQYKDRISQVLKTQLASKIVLACGGMAHVYPLSSNSIYSTGDGLVLARQVGAQLKDMEFIQFHPTALDLPDAPKLLISETLRGEGAKLIDQNFQKIMKDLHPLEDLAPRDFISRILFQRIQNQQKSFLDISFLDSDYLKQRFPKVYQLCLRYGVDLTKEAIPITPVAHYCMGGVAVDLNGRSNVKNLYACGELAHSGVHGANRLASNSLSEASCFALHVAQNIRDHLPWKVVSTHQQEFPKGQNQMTLKRLQEIMWQAFGIIRQKEKMKEFYALLLNTQSIQDQNENLDQEELNNLLFCSKVIAKAALNREKSIGSHYLQTKELS